MASSGALNCFKYLTFLINFFFFLSGVALIAVGSYALADEVAQLTSTTICALIIVVGCLVTIVSFLGCCGALKLNRGMLKAYSVFVFLFVAIEITLGSLAYVYQDEIPRIVDETWTHLYENNIDVIVDLENYYECCGFTNTTDRASPSCSFGEPCQTAVTEQVEANFVYIAYTALILGGVQVITFIITCCLICRIPTKEEKEQALLDEARRMNRDPQNYNTTSSGYNRV